ncbi:type II toxin-antitoxin system HicB family antitoxin [Silvimonas soli]|uniref:type II toxin-antitoxin system HicB family antitoxin n=1 Tax=Silvimonas soli TaxID=2980100 RepID=UPI0024B3A70B|nr:type II toxin-antitoxin system HicB family antitoxin [Silvimonas soli]
MLTYPVSLTRDDNDTFLVTFPDIPEAITVGDDEPQALASALEALEAALDIYFDEKRQIPMPSKIGRDHRTVTLPVLVTAKVFLANEMLRQGVKKSELARRMDIHMPQVDRLLDLKHSSKIELVEVALQKLGKRLDITVN